MSTFRSSLHAGAAALALIAGAVCVTPPALAQSQITLPSASLEDSLNALSRQAGVQILVDQNLLRGKKAGAINGAPSVEAALSQLLRGSGLSYQKRGDAFLIVRDGAGATPASLQIAPLGAEAERDTMVSGVVVTGSRIVRPELASAMPVSVTRMDDAFMMGRTSAYDALKLDSVMGIGQNLSSGSSGWDAGISTFNLRNLGSNRSLTLIDGQRRVSASARTSAVDVGMIPAGMIDRIEVVTGGAAAIYGADAVTGAVNIITKRDIDSLNISATSGVSERGDAKEHLVSISTGGRFADQRGSFSIGGTWAKSDPLMKMQRFDPAINPSFLANPENTGINDGIYDRSLVMNARQFYYSYEPTYWLNGKTYLIENGTPREAVCGKWYIQGEFSLCDGGDGRNLGDQDQLRGGIDSLAFMGRLDYELTERLEMGGYFSYARQDYRGYGGPVRDDSRMTFFSGAGGSVAYLDNPYLPDAVRQVMLENGLTRLNISRTFGNFPGKEYIHDRESLTTGLTLAGRLDGGLRWETFWQYGQTTDDSTERYIAVRSHWIAARDVIADPVTGEPVCRDSAARAAGCIPLNIFSQEAPSRELLNYAMADRHEDRINRQHVFGASLSGGLFALPAGEISFVLGAEHRWESLKTTDDPMALNGELQYSMGPAAHPELDVSFDVSEVFGEIVVPLLRDRPFAERLELEAAYRYSHYSTVGGTDAWKVGATWSPFDGLSFRGVLSRSVRTPNFAELYEPQVTVQQGSIDDPCELAAYHASPTRAANCAALGVLTPLPDVKIGPLTTTGGNPDLKPETSNSFTLGAILQPKFLPGFSLTADYWDIDIEDVITQFSYTRLLYLCVDLPSIDNPYCAQIVREAPLGNPISIQSTQINASRLYARGVDFGVSYRRSLGEGQLSLSLKGTRLLDKVTETTPGIAAGDVISDGGWEDQHLRATLLASYQIGGFGFNWQASHRGSSKFDVNTDSQEAYPDNRIPSSTLHDASIQYRFADRNSVTFGVRNVFNSKPILFPTVWTSNNVYDQVGRYFYTGFNLKF